MASKGRVVSNLDLTVPFNCTENAAISESTVRSTTIKN